MAKDQGMTQARARPRPMAARPAGRPPLAAPAASPPVVKPPFNPIRFLSEVRAEARKVTWTSWKETWITSVMVGIMVVLTAFFFFAVDSVLGFAISAVLKFVNAG